MLSIFVYVNPGRMKDFFGLSLCDSFFPRSIRVVLHWMLKMSTEFLAFALQEVLRRLELSICGCRNVLD